MSGNNKPVRKYIEKPGKANYDTQEERLNHEDQYAKVEAISDKLYEEHLNGRNYLDITGRLEVLHKQLQVGVSRFIVQPNLSDQLDSLKETLDAAIEMYDPNNRDLIIDKIFSSTQFEGIDEDIAIHPIQRLKGEFFGTFMFVLLGVTSEISMALIITETNEKDLSKYMSHICWGMAKAIGIFVAGAYSGNAVVVLKLTLPIVTLLTTRRWPS